MTFPSDKAKDLASRLDGVEIGCEENVITDADKANGLVVVFGASDDLMEIRGALKAEVGCYDGGTAYISANGILDESDFECGCVWAKKAKAEAISQGHAVDALWCEEGDYSWTYRTDIPHATFNVMEDGEPYCRGIVFDLAATTIA